MICTLTLVYKLRLTMMSPSPSPFHNSPCPPPPLIEVSTTTMLELEVTGLQAKAYNDDVLFPIPFTTTLPPPLYPTLPHFLPPPPLIDGWVLSHDTSQGPSLCWTWLVYKLKLTMMMSSSPPPSPQPSLPPLLSTTLPTFCPPPPHRWMGFCLMTPAKVHPFVGLDWFTS